MQIKDKKILVTGAGSGIGRALTLKLLSGGASVIAVDLNEDSLDELSKKAGSDKLVTQVFNITDQEAVLNAAKKFEKIDILINNAGIIQPFVSVGNIDYEAIEKVMKVNFYGTLNMTKAFLNYLLKRPEAHIVNVSSMGGFLPVPGQSIYGASKAAVKLLTEGLYAELKDTNVHVSVVFPGATKTNISENSGVSTPGQEKSDKKNQKIPMLSAEEAAQEIIRGVEKNKVQIFLGKDSKFMNLLYRLRPVFATDFIAKKMSSLLSDKQS